MGGAAIDNQLSLADTFASRLRQAARAERRFEDEHRITAPRFRLDKLARGFAANLLVGGPKEDDLLFRTKSRSLKRLESIEGLDDPSLHIEDSWAVRFAAGDAERHFLQSSG